MEEEVQSLHRALVELHQRLRRETMEKYSRMNPFYEDLFDWKERGEFIFGRGKNISVYNSSTIVGDVSVGENTWIGPNTILDGTGGLTIGAFCCVSGSVHLLTHDTARWALSGGKAAYEYGRVKIGDCCFLSVGAIVTRGVTIGKCSLIGAGAVVTKNVPEFSIAAGVPARVIGEVVLKEDRVEYRYTKKRRRSPSEAG
jgi:acetyltransferase-like isoleucine patch superfamily enzyme